MKRATYWAKKWGIKIPLGEYGKFCTYIRAIQADARDSALEEAMQECHTELSNKVFRDEIFDAILALRIRYRGYEKMTESELSSIPKHMSQINQEEI